MRVLLLTVLSCGGLFAFPAFAIERESPGPRGNVELKVLGPDGKPLANRPVELRGWLGFEASGEPENIKARTNEHGVACFQWPLGTHAIGVEAPGIGYGQTGNFEVERKATVQPSTAPLVPYGTIEGTVAKELWEPGSRVAIEEHDHFGKLHSHAASVDALGHFAFADLRAGSYWLRLRDPAEKVKSHRIVFVTPGRKVRVGFLDGELDWEKRNAPSFVPVSKKQSELAELPRFSSYAGTVHDEHGRPVAGATVSVTDSVVPPTAYRGGVMAESTTRSNGRWHIEPGTPGSAFLGRGAFTVRRWGHPTSIMAIETTGTPTPHAPGAAGRKTDCELRLLSVGGNLDVTVVSDGKSLQYASVSVIRTQRWWQYGLGADDLLATSGSLTDQGGLIRFEHLLPGSYTIVAAANEVHATAQALLDPAGLPAEAGRFTVQRGITIGAGENRKLRVSVHRQWYEPQVRLLNSDGRLYSDKPQIDCSGPGLFEKDFRYRRVPIALDSLRGGQYFEVTATLASSARLGNFVNVLTSQFKESGSFMVQLEDIHGHPARGYVVVGRHFNTGGIAGTTDARDQVHFEKAVSRGWDYPYRIEGFIAGSTVPSVGFDDGPLPKDRELVGHALPYQQEFKLSEDKDNRVTLRAKPVGYVRGIVRPARGSTYADYRVDGDRSSTQSAIHYSRQSGEFVFGPLPEGRVSMWLGGTTGSSRLFLRRSVDVRSDRVVHMEFDAEHPEPKANAPPPANPYPPSEEVHGTVLLADGRTPAFGATLSTEAMWNIRYPKLSFTQYHAAINGLWFGADWTPQTSAKGRFKQSLVLHSGVPPFEVIDQTLIAAMPGICGAVALPITEKNVHDEVSLVLPPPIKVRGTLTLAGKPIAGRDGQYVVLASYAGDLHLQGAANVAASVGDDGRFELAGLTPGPYEVQAALDGIWLSGVTPLTVKNRAGELKPLALDIAAPGVPSSVKCVGADGKPKPGVKASVVRPGPLAKFLPGDLVSDGAGVIHVPPLEAGDHQLHVDGVAHDPVLHVPAITGPDIRALELTVTVE